MAATADGDNDIYWALSVPRGNRFLCLNDKKYSSVYGIVYSPLNIEFLSRAEKHANYGWAAQRVPQLDNGINPAFNWKTDSRRYHSTVAQPEPSPQRVQRQFLWRRGEGRRLPRLEYRLQIERTLPGHSSFGRVCRQAGPRPDAKPALENDLDQKYLALGNLLMHRSRRRRRWQPGSGFHPSFVGSVAQSLRPYPQFLGISEADSTEGFSTYISLEVTVQRRMADMTSRRLYRSKLLFGGSFQAAQLRSTRKQMPQ